ncbi:hypothetical protein PG999_012263 [Apiospora kogelbergensis]|uniref:Carbohydrate kinase PfkB domain-containing protein n=1 Tax=Apiospora kogelbergensis TaxID=1337665 RepID=A0AAW0QI04_9PEZI
MPPDINFVSLGMLVLDELHLPGGQVLRDGVGGSGAWSMLGARIAAGPKAAQQVGSFVVAGRDFPESAAQAVRELGVTLEMLVDETRESTRGRLVYHDETFNSQQDIQLSDHAAATHTWPATPQSPGVQVLPHAPSPEAIAIQVPQLLRRRREAGILDDPLIVWEPLPWKCTPEHLAAHRDACKLVSVFSPNHLELLGLYGLAEANKAAEALAAEKQVVRDCAASLHADVVADGDAGWGGIVAVRYAEKGCVVCFCDDAATDTARKPHVATFPPYHVYQDRVVDATGAGNAFLGALAVTLAAADASQSTGEERTQRGMAAAALPARGDTRAVLMEAIVRASVVASFAIEQIGFPRRVTVGDGDGEERKEQWNGDTVSKRYVAFAERAAEFTYAL